MKCHTRAESTPPLLGGPDMPVYSYTALDNRGNEKSGTVEADSEASAVSRIRERGLFPTQVVEGGAVKGKAKSPKAAKGKSGAKGGGTSVSMNMDIKLPSWMSRVKVKELMVTTRQLATLVNAGLPLLRCLNVLQRQERNPLMKSALADMAESIQSGSTFAEALSQHPRIFNRLYINMVKAGELGGVMDVVLVRLAEFMEKAEKIKGKVVSAMVYPIVVLFMAFAILTFLMIYVIPKFEEIFNDLLSGKGLPLLTRLVMNASRGFVSNSPYIIGGIVLLIVAFVFIKRLPKARFALDKMKLKMPLFGVLFIKTAISRFSRTLGTLLTSGVPVLQALNIVRDTAGNEVISRAVNSIHDAVKEGENMAPPIDACGVFPPIVVSMVEVGEETGDLPEMLIKVADSYDDEVDNAVAGLTSIIEPLLIVFLALIVGVIVVALFLPLVSVIGNLTGG